MNELWARISAEPARPARIAQHRASSWLVLATVSIGAFMGQLDASIVSVAFPTMRREFHATVGEVQWIGLSYLLVLVALVPAVGRIADMFGRKLLYTYGFGVFILGSALCAVSQSLVLLDCSRALQALGAAMLQANSVAIIALAMSRDRLGFAIGIQGAAQALGLALGPVVGGVLIAAGGWRWVFLVNIPAGLIGLVAAWYLLPRSRDLQPRTKLDWGGLMLFAPGIGSAVFALSYGQAFGWLSRSVVGATAGAVVLLLGFVAVERRARAPLVDVRLFHSQAFATGILSGLLAYVVLFGLLFISPFLLEDGLHATPGRAGAVLAALPIAIGLTAPFAGRMADSIGARRCTTSGMLICAAALLLLGTRHDSQAWICVGLAFAGCGVGLFTPANNRAIMHAAPRDRAGAAGGLLNASRGLGTILGLSITGLVITVTAGTVPSGGRLLGGTTAAFVVLASVALAAALVGALRGQA